MDYFDRLEQAENDILILCILTEAKCIFNMLDDISEALDETDIDIMKGKIMQSIGACALTADEILAAVWEFVYRDHPALSQDVKDELSKFQRTT